MKLQIRRFKNHKRLLKGVHWGPFAAAAVAMLALSTPAKSQFTIFSPADDAAATYDSQKPDPATPYETRQGTASVLNVGRQGGGSKYHQSAVFPFQLPTLGEGESFGTASFQFNLEPETFPVQNCDLYGLAVRETEEVLPGTGGYAEPGDFYMGGLLGAPADDETPGVTKIQDNILVNGASPGPQTTSGDGSITLVEYLNEQYADGANAGKWIFLRLSLDATPGGAQRYRITTSEGGSEGPPDTRPRLVYTIGGEQVDTIQLETASDGSGTVIPAQNLTAGDSFTAYAVARDSGGAFVDNVAVSWTMENTTGGVSLADLDVASDLKSATFNAGPVGTGDLAAVGNTVNPIAPISIDVAIGPASQLVIETAADGSGVPVTDQTLYLGDVLDVFSISRDAGGNFIENVVASWSLENITGSIIPEDLFDYGDGSAIFDPRLAGTANIRAMFGSLPVADSGLLTVEELVSRWDGTGNNSSWQNNQNWVGDELPLFDNQTDLFLFDSAITRRFSYIADNIIARSINFDEFGGGQFTVSLVLLGALPAYLTFDTDSETEPAEFNVTEESVDPITFGFWANTQDGAGDIKLADDLLVTHNGSGVLTFNADIVETDGPKSITKSGTGTFVISGSNSYTGNTTVTAGTLRVTGKSIADTATLVIEGGIVDVTADEYIAGLSLPGMPNLPDGEYGSTGSGVAVPDDVNFTGSGKIIVGPPPVGGDNIVITSISKTGDEEITIEFTSPGPVDIYGSTVSGGFVWSLFEEDVPSATWVDTFASPAQSFYILVTAGDPAPPDSP